MPGNTSDKTTLRGFLQRIEAQYGKAGRTWVDRGIPTEAVLAEMRAAETPTHYLVGTPRGRLSQMEKDFLAKPWAQVRDAVRVKLVEQDGELYILARSGARRDKEQAMRRRRLKKLVKRLHELRQQKLTRDQLLIKLGAARKEAGPAVWRIIELRLPEKDQIVTPETFGFRLNWQNLREARRREGSYLLRSNLTAGDPAQLWAFYLQLTEVEQAFKELKGDLAIRPIYHQTDERIEAHILVAFLAYCLQVTLKQRLRALAPGLTARSVLDKMAAIQMVDVQLPTTDGRTVILSRYTEPERDQALLLQRLKINLPDQPPPRITTDGIPMHNHRPFCGADLAASRPRKSDRLRDASPRVAKVGLASAPWRAVARARLSVAWPVRRSVRAQATLRRRSDPVTRASRARACARRIRRFEGRRQDHRERDRQRSSTSWAGAISSQSEEAATGKPALLTSTSRPPSPAIDRVLAVNLRGAVLCARAAIRHFLTRPFGR